MPEFIVITGVLVLAAALYWWHRQKKRQSADLNPQITISFDATKSYTESDDDRRYAEFVDAMWKRAGAALGGMKVERLSRDGSVVACDLVSVVTDDRGESYVNVLESGERKTYAIDNRHGWRRKGQPFDSSAFLGVLAGADPDRALRFDRHPRNLEEALLPENDRIVTDDPRLVICYLNSKGQMSFRVVSRVVRGRDVFSARCHFRWGARRTFMYDGLKSVTDAQTGEVIPVAEFAEGSRRPRRKRRLIKGPAELRKRPRP